MMLACRSFKTMRRQCRGFCAMFWTRCKVSGKVFLAVQGRGDVLMLPTGWWHAVWNTTATVAVTENSVRKRL